MLQPLEKVYTYLQAVLHPPKKLYTDMCTVHIGIGLSGEGRGQAPPPLLTRFSLARAVVCGGGGA